MSLSTESILRVFTDEIAQHSGQVNETFHVQGRLFARSILPLVKPVKGNDMIRGGVALKATDDQVWVHPYTLRVICTNGAIAATAVQTRHVTDLRLISEDDAVDIVREAVQISCSEEAFDRSVSQMRTASEIEADQLINIMPIIQRIASLGQGKLHEQMLRRFFHEQDRSVFGLMNAVTSIARDTRDPALRWNLEELGGCIPAMAEPPKPVRGQSIRKCVFDTAGVGH